VRVDVLAPAYWPEVRRGGERMAHDLATGLAGRGHHVRIVTAHGGRPSRSVEQGVEVVRHWRPPDARLRRRGYEDHLTHAPFTFATLRRRPPDVVLALHHVDALAAIRAGVPTLWAYLGVPHRAGLANRRLRLDLVRRAVRGSAALVAISHAAARAFERWLGVLPHVVHPGVDVGAFTPDGTSAEAFTVLCPAALDAPHKRPELLLEAFSLVRRQRPGARLVVQAGGPRGPGVEHRDLDRHAALVAAYREAHVTALASRGEAFGLVLAESLACGTPAVACDDAAGPEVIGPGGSVFAGEDPQALASAVLRAAAVDAGTCRRQAERFSLERSLTGYETLLRALA
jgi:glycosyltransferase involved in cell wall biosynthesis